MIDSLPGGMGLPAGTPQRPTTPYTYPAVHDMPPPRSDQPMTVDQQLRMERDLSTLRDRQAAEAGADTGVKKPNPSAKTQPAPKVTKKQPSDVIVVPPAGASGNP